MANQRSNSQSDKELELLNSLAVQIWENIFGMPFFKAYVTSNSYLSSWEDCHPDGREGLIESINDTYDVDISDYYDEPIPDVLLVIAKEITTEKCPHCEGFEIELQRPGCSTMLFFPVLLFMYLRTKKGILYRCHNCGKRFRLQLSQPHQ
ncbi:hypothetical protein P4C99_09760 [Pontiellaceae bacterium B1224]|nr:hypothetical protein [Pontiellaceae bacterium B1224]